MPGNPPESHGAAKYQPLLIYGNSLYIRIFLCCRNESGHPFFFIQLKPFPAGAAPVYEGPVIGITMDRQKLYERINQRVDLMFAQGLEQEVRALLHHGIPEDCQAFKGIGYKEVLLALHGEITMEEARELIKKNTRHFAKRQLTWFRHMPYIQWVDRTGRDKADWYEEVESIIHSAFSAQ